MKTASVAEVKTQINSLLKASENGPIVVTRKGKPVAVILGVQNEEQMDRLLMAHSLCLQAILEKSRNQIRAGESFTHDEFWAKVVSARKVRDRAKTHKR